jgi:hypothetical protein
MNLDFTSIVLMVAAAALGMIYFARRSNRMKRSNRKF